jgi:hypothetical protein
MYTKTIPFKDLDGNDVAEEFHFHLTKADLVEIQISHKGGIHAYLKRITEEEDEKAAYGIFKDLVLRAIGRRGEDGRQFLKSKEISDGFMQTDAYSEFLLKLLSDAKEASEFINGVFPKEVVEQMAANEKEHTIEELQAMTDEEFFKIAGTNPATMSKNQLVVAMGRKNAA